MIHARAVSWWRRLCYTRVRDAFRGRFDASLDWRQVISVADLPPEISGVLRNAVGRTRLWRSEKIDVARELAAHFQDGLSTGRTPQQLLHTFGDPRTAAQLIRRAKKRGRPLLWHVWRGCCGTIVALVVAYVAVGFHALSGRPSIKTDYLAVFNARAFAVPEAERTWPLYRNAMSEIGGTDRLAGSPNPLANNVHWENDGWAAAEQFVAKNAVSIAMLREAGRRASLGFPVWPEDESFAPEDRQFLARRYSDSAGPDARTFRDLKDRMLFETQLPQTTLLQQASGLLATDARRAASLGQANIALADVLAQLGMSRQVQEAPCITSAFTAGAIQSMAYSVVQDVLADHPELWTADELRNLAHEFAQNDLDWGRALEGQRSMFYDVVQRIYTDDGIGGGRLVPGGMQILSRLGPRFQSWNEQDYWWPTDETALIALPAADVFFASRAKMTALYERHLARVAQAMATPIWEWNLSPPQALVPSFDAQPWQAYRYYLVTVLAPVTAGVPKMAEHRRGMRDGVLLGLALELYRREQGAWPISLSALVPRWLPSLPVDRMSGRPLHFKLLAGRVLVYSEGADLDDDGGRLPPGSAWKNETPDAALAGPIFWTGTPVTELANDGDWVIWSTKNGKEPTKWYPAGGKE